MAANTATTETVLRAEPSELDGLSQVAGRLDAILSRLQPARLVGPDGESIELPDAAFEALKVIVNALARGQTITVIPHNKELTTQAAADLLHVSRPHLIKLLDAGQLPSHRVGTHRRIRIDDVLAYQGRRDQTRKTALDELARTDSSTPPHADQPTGRQPRSALISRLLADAHGSADADKVGSGRSDSAPTSSQKPDAPRDVVLDGSPGRPLALS